MLFIVLFSVSVAAGAVLFVRLLGPDDWLVKGLREDKGSAVVVTCCVVVCAVLLMISLIFFLRVIPSLLAYVLYLPFWQPLLAAAIAGSDSEVPTGHARESLVWNVVHWFLSLCIPIVSGYLLHLLYSAGYRVFRRFSPNLSHSLGKHRLLSRHLR